MSRKPWAKRDTSRRDSLAGRVRNAANGSHCVMVSCAVPVIVSLA